MTHLARNGQIRKSWRPEEDAILAEAYQEPPSTRRDMLERRLPNRTWYACETRARDIGLRVPGMDEEAWERKRRVDACNRLLARLIEYHGQMGRMIDALIQTTDAEPPVAASQLPQPGRTRGDKVKAILAETCSLFGVTKIDLTGAGRTASYVNARRHATQRLRDELGLSYPAIGRLLGDRDHTTAMNLYRTHERAAEWLAQRGAE